MIHLVTFSDESMSRARELCVQSALRHGATEVYPWTQAQLFESGVCRTSDVFEQVIALMVYPKGLGFWSWKPLVITESLSLCSDGDILVYADSGVEFINNVNYIIDRMGHEKPQDDVWLFGNNWEHAHWCKRDVVEAIWPVRFQGRTVDVGDQIWQDFGKQVQASVIFFRVSDYTRKFVKEWLDWCLFEGGRLIDDSPSRLPNHPEFREHRHDQAILTTLAYREGIKLHYWPAVYNKGGTPEFLYEQLPEYAGDDYPILFSHNRRRDHEWEQVA